MKSLHYLTWHQLHWVLLDFLSTYYLNQPRHVLQDNKSTIRMKNGRPDGTYSRHIDNRYFWLTDLASRSEVRGEHI